MENVGYKVFAVVMVILLMGTSVALFLVMDAMQKANPDPHDASYEYSVTGFLYDEPCIGTGHSDYTPENNNTYLYHVVLEFSSASHSDKTDFPVIFNSDEVMEPDLYTYIGKETLEGRELSVYIRDYSGVSEKYYVGELCKIIRMIIETENYSIVADIVEDSA